LTEDLQNRLAKCFETVFPALSPSEIPGCSQTSVSGWDSVAAITLGNVIEDEFGFQMDYDLLPELDSFDRILTYVKTHFEN
jgi:acyl carrier protein